jgi:RNA polymerase sigma-70 factor (ECF subfamily)
MTTRRDDVTAVLEQVRRGEEGAFEALLAALYADLRRVAGAAFRRERASHTLQPTALVHEAYLRLVNQPEARWESRAHFLNAAAQVMRRVLVDHARARQAEKRGGGGVRVTLEESLASTDGRDLDLLALDQGLTRLSEVDEQLARVVELRAFGGLSTREIAHALDMSERSVERAWTTARTWLRMEMSREATP